LTSCSIIFIFLFNVQSAFASSSSQDCYNTPQCTDIFRQEHSKCPGRYCGREMNSEGLVVNEECKSCPRGYRTDHYVCLPCEKKINTYSILYLAFMFSITWLIQFLVIAITSEKEKSRIILSICVTLEAGVSLILSLLSFKPLGSLNLDSCGVKRLADWYSIFHNPRNYHCASEAIYPLWTIPMVFFAYGVIGILVRAVISAKVCHGHGTKSVYFGMYLMPILLLIQIIFGGLLYYSFPYLVLGLVLITDIRSYMVLKKTRFTKIEYLIPHLLLYLGYVFANISILIYFEANLLFLILACLSPFLPTILLLILDNRPVLKFFRSCWMKIL